jgi:uncharacterized membrane protein YvlD (DUF360 family)
VDRSRLFKRQHQLSESAKCYRGGRLFMIIVNGLTVYLASRLYSPLDITNFWAAIFAGIIIGLVNYLVTAILEDVRSPS